MNINEIINKTQLEQSEVQYVVEQYIEELTGKKVEINLLKYTNQMPDFIKDMYLQNQLQQLHQAFEKACKYFANKI